MSTLSVTIDVTEDAIQKRSQLLAEFPKGSRIRVAFSDDPVPASETPTPEDYIAGVDVVLSKLPPSPWATTEDAMSDLRAGEVE